jgi:hypothetical protein
LNRDYGTSEVGNGDLNQPRDGGGPVCDESGAYDTLEKIDAAPWLDPYCAERYTAKALHTLLQQARFTYERVNQGYDSKFESYAEYMEKALPLALSGYVYWLDKEASGNAFFDCEFEGNGNTYNGPCPVPRDVHGTILIGGMTLHMTLRDADGFWPALMENTGIAQEWIEFGSDTDTMICNAPGPLCIPYEVTITGIPKLKSDFEMPNPKDVVVEAMGNTGQLESELVARILDLGLGLWQGDNADILQTLSMPVFLLEGAVQGMEQASEIGAEAEAAEAEATLLIILSSIFMIIPLIGQAGAAVLRAATIARIASMVGIAGEAGLAIHDVIQNPAMAPLLIMDLLTGGRLKTPREYADAANVRRAMNPNDLGKLGD